MMTANNIPKSLTHVSVRFFGALNDFLSRKHRRPLYHCYLLGHPSVKDTIEALGIPHTEVDAIMVRGCSVDFSYLCQEDDLIQVYPDAHRLKKKKIKSLRPQLPRKLKFVLDCHLGKLARYLRLLGVDTVYKNHFPDAEIITQAIKEKRVILTRDIGILKHSCVRYGYWLRSTNPQQQLKEVQAQYGRGLRQRPFSRCLVCNGNVRRVAKQQVLDQLPPQTRDAFHCFYQCTACKKVYWQGSHHQHLLKIIRLVDVKGQAI